MYRHLFLIALAVVFLSGQRNAERFAWDANDPLEWSDFKAVPDRRAPYSATANSGLSHRYTIDSKGFLVKKASVITANFYPNLSWYKPQLIDENTLAHEQTHFDISELHARLLRKAIDEYRFTKNSKSEIQKIYNAIEVKRREMQTQFDNETDHSQNEAAEKKWEAFVKNSLYKLRNYS